MWNERIRLHARNASKRAVLVEFLKKVDTSIVPERMLTAEEAAEEAAEASFLVGVQAMYNVAFCGVVGH